MARRSQRLRRQKRLSRLQQKLQDTNQLKQQTDNSVMIEKLKETEKPRDLMKLLKSDLLSMAKDLNCDVSNKNTKAQIVEAIEKQSK